MKPFILGIKKEQNQIYSETKERIPVTHIITKPCFLVGIRKKEKDGYNALIIGFGKRSKTLKPDLGKLKKAGIKTPLRFFREYRVTNIEFDTQNQNKIRLSNTSFSIGDELFPSLLFHKGSLVQITGISKGKGFQGVVKRHGFRGGPRTHGQSDRERAPGSIGMTTTPGRVFKGKRMAGRMGGNKITVKNLQIIDCDEQSLIVKGLVPGPKNSLVVIKGM